MAACPSSPDNIKTVAQIAGTKVGQVLIGSCTNSSFADLMMAAAVLKGRYINNMVEFGIAPGSREVLNMLAKNNCLSDIISAGGRILETGCGPCIGLGVGLLEDGEIKDFREDENDGIALTVVDEDGTPIVITTTIDKNGVISFD